VTIPAPNANKEGNADKTCCRSIALIRWLSKRADHSATITVIDVNNTNISRPRPKTQDMVMTKTNESRP